MSRYIFKNKDTSVIYDPVETGCCNGICLNIHCYDCYINNTIMPRIKNSDCSCMQITQLYPQEIAEAFNCEAILIDGSGIKDEEMPISDSNDVSTKNDNVNHPSHYTQGGVECIEALKAATSHLTGIEAVCTANAIKYLWRWKDKNGIEDLNKAKWYIDYIISFLSSEEKENDYPVFSEKICDSDCKYFYTSDENPPCCMCSGTVCPDSPEYETRHCYYNPS